MNLRSTDRRWGAVARLFHWLMAIGILGVGALGVYMTGLPRGMGKLQVYALHKSIGLTLLALFLLRLLWRLADRRPLDEPAPRWQLRAAHLTHGLLYLLMAAIPLSGWLLNSVRGFPLQWFKLFNLPALAGKDEDAVGLAHVAHEYLFWLLVVVVVGHAGAALKHHLIDRDDTLRRMLPFARLRGESAPNPGGTP